MNRSRAERAVEESDLDQAEALMMMMLLRRAHNDTLEITEGGNNMMVTEGISRSL